MKSFLESTAIASFAINALALKFSNICYALLVNLMNRQDTLKEFQTLPGVGKSISEDLWNMGFRSPKELKNKDPEELYEQINELYGKKIDRCMLYVFRCIVYFVSTETHEKKLLNWWNWSDKNLKQNHIG